MMPSSILEVGNVWAVQDAGRPVVDYDAVYRQYYKKVASYLRGIVGAAEAEDLAQEAFIKVGTKLSSLKDPSKMSSWIFKIALNTARDRLRQPSTQRLAGDRVSIQPGGRAKEDALSQVADTHSRTAEDSLFRSEMIQCFLEFVRKLPKNYYEVYVLSEFEGLSDRAISMRLLLSLETVKMRLHRARTRLHTELRANCRCYHTERGELVGERIGGRPAERGRPS
jgi:RNA polymerase sigma-70 factor (ECF subfamily)